MYWYVIPMFTRVTVTEGITNTQYIPGVGLPGSVQESPIAGVCHAHSPKAAPTSCLIGLTTAPTLVPDGWAAKTLQEAKNHFELVCSRVPSSNEVF